MNDSERNGLSDVLCWGSKVPVGIAPFESPYRWLGVAPLEDASIHHCGNVVDLTNQELRRIFTQENGFNGW